MLGSVHNIWVGGGGGGRGTERLLKGDIDLYMSDLYLKYKWNH